MAPVATWQAAVVAAGQDEGLDAITERAIGALERELPVLHEDRDLLEAARASSAANIALAVDLVRGKLSLADLEAPPQAAAFTRELARRNVPVAELDRAYRVVQRELWRWAARQVRERLDGDVSAEIEGLSEAVFATGDALSRTVLEQYALERERWLRSADAVRASTLREVLRGDAVDFGVASARLGYDLRLDHEAFVVWSTDGVEGLEATAAVVGGSRALVVPIGASSLGGWAPAGTLETAAVDGPARVAVGTVGRGLDGFRRSHEEAVEARRVARLRATGPTVTFYADVALVALLTHDPGQAQRFAARTLGPLARTEPAMLRLADTLLAVLEEQGSPRRAAQRLGVHENTVAKRMRQVDDLLGGLDRHRTADLLAALTIVRCGPAPPRGT